MRNAVKNIIISVVMLLFTLIIIEWYIFLVPTKPIIDLCRFFAEQGRQPYVECLEDFGII